jgi:hypothetical protein
MTEFYWLIGSALFCLLMFCIAGVIFSEDFECNKYRKRK